jgi:gluconate 2-dehydrogenase gamma chain
MRKRPNGGEDAPRKLDRRRVLGAGVALGAVPIAVAAETIRGGAGPPWSANTAAYPVAADPGRGYDFFRPAEAAFVEAAAGRMIPADDLGPGAVEAGVAVFIDRQLAGDFGKASRMYMQGPWAKGEKTQGYQSRFTPAQMYRAAIPAIDDAVNRAKGGTFAGLAGPEQDAFLKEIETGQVDLGQVDAVTFFALFLQNVMEGFFSDPLYGGNRDMAGWRLIGFPGARYDQTPFVTQHGQPYPLPPVAIGGRPGWSSKG